MAAQNQKYTPGKGLIPTNRRNSTEKVAVVNHHVVPLSGTGHVSAKENVALNMQFHKLKKIVTVN